MTCQDCEVYLGQDFLTQGERNDAVAEHLGQCPECRSLQEHLRANTMTLGSLLHEEFPQLAVKIPLRRNSRPSLYPWIPLPLWRRCF